MKTNNKIQASISYLLTEKGQKESLKLGGNGHKQQLVYGDITVDDVDLFVVSETGQLTLELVKGDQPDLSTTSDTDNYYQTPRNGKQKKWDAIKTKKWQTITFDGPQSFDKLLKLKKEIVLQRANLKRLAEIEEKQYKEREVAVVTAFLEDKDLRATQINDGFAPLSCYVIIPGWEGAFYKDHLVYKEAIRRKRSDEEKLKKERQKEKREFLSRWLKDYGTDNQKERFIAGLLPEKEVLEEVKKQLFTPLSQFPLYQRITHSELCSCNSSSRFKCDIECESIEATDATANEWDKFKAILLSLRNFPGDITAKALIKKHSCKTKKCSHHATRKSVSVQLDNGIFTFLQEYALS